MYCCQFLLFRVGKSGGSYVALSADHLVAVELGCKGLKRWLDDTTTETENQMKSRFLRYLVSKRSFADFAPLFKASIPIQIHPFNSSYFFSFSFKTPALICVPFGCCSPKECVHPQVAFRRRSIAAGRGGFLPCPGSWT